MKPDQMTDIVAANATEMERAREAAEKSSPLDMVGDTATQLDSLGQIVELGGVVFNGLRAAGDCIAAVCDAIPTLD
jgi:hypothetical protein